MPTTSCFAMLNCILPNSRLDKSITSLMSFNNSSEFCRITSLHWRRVSLSNPSSVSSEEKPESAFNGVRISWLIFERNMLLADVAFSALVRRRSRFWVDRVIFCCCFLSLKAIIVNMSSSMILPASMLVISLLCSSLLAISIWSTWYLARRVLICRV